jgi:DNA-binding transcriptional LysR family regulator
VQDQLGPLHNITGAQMRAFMAVAESGGFSGAAEVLGVAQPTISKSVSALEAKVGPLFERRRGSSVRLNKAGEVLLDMAPLIIQRLVQLRRRLDAARGDTVVLRVCTGMYLHEPLRKLIAAYHRQQSLVKVRLERSSSRLRALQALRLGTVDAAFITHFSPPGGVAPEFVREGRVLLYDSASAVPSKQSQRPLILVASLELLVRGERDPILRQVAATFNDVLYAPSYEAALQMCLDGVGQTYVFAEDASEPVANGALRCIPTESIKCYRTCHVLGDDPLLLSFARTAMARLA